MTLFKAKYLVELLFTGYSLMAYFDFFERVCYASFTNDSS